MCAGFNRAQANTSEMFGVIRIARVHTTANWAMGTEEGLRFNQWRHLSGVLVVSSGTCESKMYRGGGDLTQ